MSDKSRIINPYIFRANFGLEKESIRVDAQGRPAKTPHPFPGISKISRDFSENQLEFITGVSKSPDGALIELEKLHKKAREVLETLPTGAEYIWPFSNPPAVAGDEDNPVAQFHGDSEWKTEYRKYLSEKYGNRLMLYSGIHVNFSFDEEYLNERFSDYHSRAGHSGQPQPAQGQPAREHPGSDTDNIKDRTSYVNRLYLDLAIWATKYSWLIIYLMGASPVFHSSFFDEGGPQAEIGQSPKADSPGDGHQEQKVSPAGGPDASTVISKYSSPRTGDEGYWNTFDPVLDYNGLKSYIDSIMKYVDDGSLLYPAELYYPVRLKPRGNYNLESLLQHGIDHIELRIVDVNPYAPAGIFREDLCFIHLLLVYMLAKGTKDFPEEEQLLALKDMKKAALLDDSVLLSNGKSLRDNAIEALEDMEDFFEDPAMAVAACSNCVNVVRSQKNKILENRRYAQRVVRDFGKDYQTKGLQRAKHPEDPRGQ